MAGRSSQARRESKGPQAAAAAAEEPSLEGERCTASHGMREQHWACPTQRKTTSVMERWGGLATHQQAHFCSDSTYGSWPLGLMLTEWCSWAFRLSVIIDWLCRLLWFQQWWVNTNKRAISPVRSTGERGTNPLHAKALTPPEGPPLLTVRSEIPTSCPEGCVKGEGEGEKVLDH